MNSVVDVCTVIVAPPKVKMMIYIRIQFFCQLTATATDGNI